MSAKRKAKPGKVKKLTNSTWKKTLKRRGCLRKARYETEVEAQAAADAYNELVGALPANQVRAYHCQYYAHWHVGHP